MQKGNIEEMVKLIKTNTNLAQSYAESAIKLDKGNTGDSRYLVWISI